MTDEVGSIMTNKSGTYEKQRFVKLLVKHMAKSGWEQQHHY